MNAMIPMTTKATPSRACPIFQPRVAPAIITNSVIPAASRKQPKTIEIDDTLVQSKRKTMIENRIQAAPVTRRIHQKRDASLIASAASRTSAGPAPASLIWATPVRVLDHEHHAAGIG